MSTMFRIIHTSHFHRLSLLILLISVFLPMSHAHDYNYGMGHMRYDHMRMMHRDRSHMGMHGDHFNIPDLSEKQRNAMRKLAQENIKKQNALAKQVTQHSEQLQKLYSQPKPDPAKVGEIYQKIFDIRRKMIENRITLRNKQFDLLNKAQQERIKLWRTRRFEHHHHDHHRGMHHMWR